MLKHCEGQKIGCGQQDMVVKDDDIEKRNGSVVKILVRSTPQSCGLCIVVSFGRVYCGKRRRWLLCSGETYHTTSGK